MSEEIISAFEKAQQDVMDIFKERMKEVAEQVLSKVYTDVTTWADTDAHTNYYNHLRDVLSGRIKKEVLQNQYGEWDWATRLRASIFNEHREELTNKIIEDLELKVKGLKNQIEEIYEGRYR